MKVRHFFSYPGSQFGLPRSEPGFLIRIRICWPNTIQSGSKKLDIMKVRKHWQSPVGSGFRGYLKNFLQNRDAIKQIRIQQFHWMRIRNRLQQVLPSWEHRSRWSFIRRCRFTFASHWRPPWKNAKISAKTKFCGILWKTVQFSRKSVLRIRIH
jgi:hypothetical protein